MKIPDEVLSAINRDDLRTVRCLLTEHPYLFNFDIHGWPIMHLCIASNCADLNLLKLFIANGGNVNRRTDSGVSLAFLAATNVCGKETAGHLKASGGRMSSFEEAVALLETDGERAPIIIPKLLDTEPDLIRRTGQKGLTLLHHAVRNFQYRVTEFLVERGADVNAISFAGITPLDLLGTAFEEDLACAELLVSKGARHTPLEEITVMIREGRNEDVIELFEAEPRLMHAWSPVREKPFLHVAAWLGSGLALVDYMLRHGIDPDVPNADEETALHLACETREKPEVVAVLLEHGATIDKRDDQGRTPLHRAIDLYAEENAILLVEVGADINAKSNDGQTPLDKVYASKPLILRDLAKLLKAKGARSGKSSPAADKDND